MQISEGAFLLPFHFWLPLLPSHFCPFVSNVFFGIFLFSSRRKKRKQTKKKQIEEKKCKEGRELTFKLSLYPLTLAPAFGLLFLPYCFKCFLLGICFFSSKRKEKKHKEKKHHRKEKKFREGRSLHLFSCFCIWDEALILLSFLHIPSTLSFSPSSSLVFHIFSKLCATQVRELSWALEIEWAKNEVREEGGT